MGFVLEKTHQSIDLCVINGRCMPVVPNFRTLGLFLNYYEENTCTTPRRNISRELTFCDL
jgi:hypothetical protein